MLYVNDILHTYSDTDKLEAQACLRLVWRQLAAATREMYKPNGRQAPSEPGTLARTVNFAPREPRRNRPDDCFVVRLFHSVFGDHPAQRAGLQQNEETHQYDQRDRVPDHLAKDRTYRIGAFGTIFIARGRGYHDRLRVDHFPHDSAGRICRGN